MALVFSESNTKYASMYNSWGFKSHGDIIDVESEGNNNCTSELQHQQKI